MIELIFGGLIEPPQSPLISTVIEEPVTDTLQKHIVLENESLYKIAEQYDTTWLRLFYKNTHIAHPDKLDVGIEIVIPEATEQLTERLYVIEPPVTQVAAEKPATQAVISQNRATAPAGWFSSSQCTGYIASKRPVGRWNNASEWYWQAKRDGWSTGTTPQVGAIGVAKRGNHVVYIESVRGAEVYLSERNYDYKGSYRERWASASDFNYIY